MDRGFTWYKRDPIRFLDGVQGLGPEVIGAYAVLIDLIYARGGQSKRDDRHLSGILGCSTRKATALTDRLIEVGKIDFVDGFLINEAAKIETEKARELSEKRSKASRKVYETSVKPARNEHEPVTNQSRTSREKEGELNKNSDLAEAIVEHKTSLDKNRIDITPIVPLEGDAKPKTKNKGTRLPKDWTLPKDWDRWAEKEGHPNPEREAEKFRDYWTALPGQKGTKIDWEATWRNWIRRSIENMRPKGSVPWEKPKRKNPNAMDFTTEQFNEMYGIGTGS